MRSSTNLAVQLAVLVAASLLRLLDAGWLVVIFFITVVGPALLVLHLVMAAVAMHRPRLGAAVVAPFMAAAGSLLLANVLIADVGDGPRLRSPLELLVGGYLPEGLQTAGWVLMLVWGGCVVATMIAYLATRVSPAPQRISAAQWISQAPGGR